MMTSLDLFKVVGKKFQKYSYQMVVKNGDDLPWCRIYSKKIFQQKTHHNFNYIIPKDPGMSQGRDYIYNPILVMGFVDH